MMYRDIKNGYLIDPLNCPFRLEHIKTEDDYGKHSYYSFRMKYNFTFVQFNLSIRYKTIFTHSFTYTANKDSWII